MEHRTLPEVVHGHGGGRGCVVSTGLSPGPGKPTTNVNGPHHHCSKQGQGSRGVVRRQQELMARADVSSLSLDLSMGLMDNQSFADAEVRREVGMRGNITCECARPGPLRIHAYTRLHSHIY